MNEHDHIKDLDGVCSCGWADPLTTDELRELEDLEGWVDDLFVWAGMHLSDARLQRMAYRIRADDPELQASLDRVLDKVMAEVG